MQITGVLFPTLLGTFQGKYFMTSHHIVSLISLELIGLLEMLCLHEVHVLLQMLYLIKVLCSLEELVLLEILNLPEVLCLLGTHLFK